jgi:hypothetical protein
LDVQLPKEYFWLDLAKVTKIEKEFSPDFRPEKIWAKIQKDLEQQYNFLSEEILKKIESNENLEAISIDITRHSKETIEWIEEDLKGLQYQTKIEHYTDRDHSVDVTLKIMVDKV